MAQYVGCFSPCLKTDLPRRTFPTEPHGLRAAWQMARDNGRIKVMEGPASEIDLWSGEHGLAMPVDYDR